MNIPSLIFLNIGHINRTSSFISGLVMFLAENSIKFVKFCEENKIQQPYYLYITPEQLCKYSKHNSLPTFEQIEKYSGKFASMDDLYKWGKWKCFLWQSSL